MGATAVLVGGLVAGGSGSVSAGAQVAPTLEVSPLRVVPGGVVTFTVRDCPSAPELQVGESDFVRLVEPTATGTAGTWSSQLEAGLTDWTVQGRCGDVSFDDVVVDIDNPLMAFLPIGAFAPEPDPPSNVFGSDCPDGTAVTVTFDVEGGSPSGDGFDVSGTSVRAEIDDRGDWQAPVPTTPPGSTVRVSASCGDVTYPSLSFTVPDDEPATTTSTVPTSPPTVAEPPPAVARSGRSTFTG